MIEQKNGPQGSLLKQELDASLIGGFVIQPIIKQLMPYKTSITTRKEKFEIESELLILAINAQKSAL